MRPRLLGGVDVRPVCGLRGGSGRRQHGGGLGGIVRFGGRRAAGDAVGVRLAGWLGLHGPRGGCNGPVVEEGLGLNRAARRQVQLALRSAGFDPGGADGLFGPRTRAAIRNWQSSRGGRPTGYLDEAAAAALRTADGSGAEVAATPSVLPGSTAPPQPSSAGAPAVAPAATAELEGLFWQSIMNSTNPSDFEAYLAQFPNGVFQTLAQNRLTALRQPARAVPAVSGTGVGGRGAPAPGSRVSGVSAPALGAAAGGDVRRRPGEVFRDCAECPEMVVLAGGRLAMGRYEVTVGEYRAFASATGGASGGECFGPRDVVVSWRNPGFPQTDRHPVTCVSRDDAQAYVSWLSRTTGATYRLPTEAEWERAAAGARPGCDRLGRGTIPNGTCPVGASVANAAGLSDMVGTICGSGRRAAGRATAAAVCCAAVHGSTPWRPCAPARAAGGGAPEVGTTLSVFACRGRLIDS